ncbi:MAG: transferase [Firmicutes bacterium]|nr:transferase [Bacillota bacterium]
MYIDFSVGDRTIKENTTLFSRIDDTINFPVLCIGRDSYIWNGKVNTGIPFTIQNGFAIHNLHFGKFVAIANGAEFCMGVGHNFLSLAMGVSDLFEKNVTGNFKYRQKGQILIQNDVWFGHDVTVMPGVIIHNGAVVAANSHVVKDVPPYAIVGGNPAKIIKYRFSKEIIDKLLTIQWWNWSEEKIQDNKDFFYKENIDEFCNKFYDEAIQQKAKIKEIEFEKLKHTYLFFQDFSEPYNVWKRVLDEFMTKFKQEADYLLIIYIEEEFANTNQQIMSEFNQYIDEKLINENAVCSIAICTDTKENERAIFKSIDYFIANRSRDTILRSCYADENNVKIISGVDVPIF